MSKIIEIENCLDCLFRQDNSIHEDGCSSDYCRVHKDLRSLKNEGILPIWCPLRITKITVKLKQN